VCEQLRFLSLLEESETPLWETLPVPERSEIITCLSWILVKAAREEGVAETVEELP